jgi:pimeloyl-ACP methyl ester carboxylesterase
MWAVRLNHAPAHMKTLLKIAKYTAIVMVAGIVLIAAALFSLRAYNQHQMARALAITASNGIDESGYVKIGGIDQWVQIRGQDRHNPVLLCVHGGPGASWIPLTALFRSWEKDFTVVLWDERGTGKTLKSTGPAIASTMTFDRMISDGIEVAEHLRTKLGKEKIVLLGHSFGSVLATRMAIKRPDLFWAYVGTGQVSDLPRGIGMEYSRSLALARQRHDAATVQALESIGAPPFTNGNQVATYFEQTGKFQPPADDVGLGLMKQSLMAPVPGYSLSDELNRIRGFRAVPPWALYDELLKTKLLGKETEFQIPVFFFQGSEDTVTQLSLAKEYFDSIKAPRKEFVVLEKAGHFAMWSMAGPFGKELSARVRPLAR